MRRCLQLATKGLGNVAPNPMVGAVLVYEDRIIGEGYHMQYGQAHAEVNCINAVKDEDRQLISKSTLYVSLEPCSHYGKTPPCTNLILDQHIPTVVIACKDSFAAVNGSGITRLTDNGVEVILGILEKEARELNKRFFTFHEQQRPYVILKWAQSKNRKIANADFSRVHISNEYTNTLVHKWRSEEAAIMVGTNTALHDNPSLTTRNWEGKNPVRLVIDLDLRLPQELNVFDNTTPTIVFNKQKSEVVSPSLQYVKVEDKLDPLPEILHHLFALNLQSLIVEGGASLLNSFITGQYWDEARVITSHITYIPDGIAAPEILNLTPVAQEKIFTDTINYYKR